MNVWRELFPNLFARAPFEWGGVAAGGLEIQFSLEPPPDELVSNVKIIGRAAGGVVVCKSDQGWRFLPGGTREADVDLQGRPTNPADGEAVIEVLTLPPLEAVDYLAGFDDGQLTEVLRLAIAMGHV
jgi:8-oxo-dGTP diphosphatase